MWIISSNGEEPTTDQGALDEIHTQKHHHGKSKINISLCIMKSYQRTDIDDIRSKFDQVRPVVSHLEFHLLEKPFTPKKIGEDLKGPQNQ